MSMSKYLSGDPMSSMVMDTEPSFDPTGGMFDLLGNYGESYAEIQVAKQNAAAIQAQAAAQAPVQLMQAKNSQLFLIGAIVIGIMLIAKKS